MSRGMRFAAGLSGCLLAGGVAAFADAARAAGGTPGGRLLVAELGLYAPLALVLGLGAGLLRAFTLPPDWPSPRRALAALGSAPDELRARLGVGGALAAVATLAALVLVGRVALRALASGDAAGPSGAGLALATLGVAVLVALVAAGAAPLASGFLGGRARPLPSPLVLVGASLGAAVALFGLLVAFGETSGAGSALALFGVFRREELDLWPPALALVTLGGGLLLPVFRRSAATLGLLVAGLALLAAAPYAARSAFDRKTSLAVERRAPLGKRLLLAARRATDGDRDGASGLYGGGDCAEGDPKRSPSAEDVPGNGVDEDCSGSDAAKIAAPAAPEARPVAAEAAIRDRLPKNANVILLTIDALRAELGVTGYHRNISPNIDALAKKSALFTRAYSLASYTSKSLGPMLIGRYASETHRGFLHFNRFTRDDTFVSERLQAAGVRTVSVQGHWYFFKNYGFERGYDVTDTKATPADQPIEGDKSTNSAELSDRIIAQLEDPKLENTRFFLWTHYLDPHAEYIAHEGFDFGHRGRERYDGEIAYTDHHVGRVLGALERRPFASRTIVVISSDHGEAFGEHDLYRHGFELWEELVRIPLVIYVPGAEPRRIDVRRSAIDVAPTLLEIYGIAPPAAGAKDALRGQSLLPDVLGPKEAVPAARPIYIDMPAGPYNDERMAFIDGSLKIVTTGGRPLGLFDLDKDPGEKRDLLDDATLARPMLEKTKAFRRSLDEVFERAK
ncbi:MAG TPA: sulfatase [Polyangiaceae bacterium]